MLNIYKERMLHNIWMHTGLHKSIQIVIIYSLSGLSHHIDQGLTDFIMLETGFYRVYCGWSFFAFNLVISCSPWDRNILYLTVGSIDIISFILWMQHSQNKAFETIINLYGRYLKYDPEFLCRKLLFCLVFTKICFPLTSG